MSHLFASVFLFQLLFFRIHNAFLHAKKFLSDFYLLFFISPLIFYLSYVIIHSLHAGVMELADVRDSKSRGSDTVWVRPPPPAPKSHSPHFRGLWLFGAGRTQRHRRRGFACRELSDGRSKPLPYNVTKYPQSVGESLGAPASLWLPVFREEQAPPLQSNEIFPTVGERLVCSRIRDKKNLCYPSLRSGYYRNPLGGGGKTNVAAVAGGWAQFAPRLSICLTGKFSKRDRRRN